MSVAMRVPDAKTAKFRGNRPRDSFHTAHVEVFLNGWDFLVGADLVSRTLV